MSRVHSAPISQTIPHTSPPRRRTRAAPSFSVVAEVGPSPTSVGALGPKQSSAAGVCAVSPGWTPGRMPGSATRVTPSVEARRSGVPADQALAGVLAEPRLPQAGTEAGTEACSACRAPSMLVTCEALGEGSAALALNCSTCAESEESRGALGRPCPESRDARIRRRFASTIGESACGEGARRHECREGTGKVQGRYREGACGEGARRHESTSPNHCVDPAESLCQPRRRTTTVAPNTSIAPPRAPAPAPTLGGAMHSRYSGWFAACEVCSGGCGTCSSRRGGYMT